MCNIRLGGGWGWGVGRQPGKGNWKLGQCIVPEIGSGGHRVQELCKSGGGRFWLPVPNSLYGSVDVKQY